MTDNRYQQIGMGDSDDRAYLDEFPRPGLIEGASDGRGMGLESQDAWGENLDVHTEDRKA